MKFLLLKLTPPSVSKDDYHSKKKVEPSILFEHQMEQTDYRRPFTYFKKVFSKCIETNS